MTCHCPGPWEVVKEAHSFNYAVFGPGPRDIIAHVIDLFFPNDVVTANAQLIAAAPQLFSALSEIVELAALTDDFTSVDDASLETSLRLAVHKAKEALSKAIAPVPPQKQLARGEQR